MMKRVSAYPLWMYIKVYLMDGHIYMALFDLLARNACTTKYGIWCQLGGSRWEGANSRVEFLKTAVSHVTVAKKIATSYVTNNF